MGHSEKITFFHWASEMSVGRKRGFWPQLWHSYYNHHCMKNSLCLSAHRRVRNPAEFRPTPPQERPKGPKTPRDPSQDPSKTRGPSGRTNHLENQCIRIFCSALGLSVLFWGSSYMGDDRMFSIRSHFCSNHFDSSDCCPLLLLILALT